ncbi:phospholipase D-like domain-containing protein [Streptomyces sp. NPDC005574]|uniref:phospholipase D-like domain-containing protein n=1 Tax=Streptomyces sp. NPDC005574 TaxID=3156891 RepID=UPI0033A02969
MRRQPADSPTGTTAHRRRAAVTPAGPRTSTPAASAPRLLLRPPLPQFGTGQVTFRVPALAAHAELVVADRHTALLGSANLTDRALSDNIELGVVLRDPHLVESLVDHFRWLLKLENNIMRPARHGRREAPPT